MKRRDQILNRLLTLIDVEGGPLLPPGLALLWMASARGLGSLDDSNATETFDAGEHTLADE